MRGDYDMSTVVQDHVNIMEDVLLKEKDSSNNQVDSVHLVEGHPYGIRTRVSIFNKQTGECVFVGRNKTMLAGSEFMALNLFNLPTEDYITPSYNTELGLDQTATSDKPDGTRYVCQLFCMGTSGCNRESALRYEVVNKWWIKPEDMVPFQYVSPSADLDPTQRSKYFGRAELASGRIAYYFKKFDSDPILKRQLQDGTAIDNTIYKDTSELVAQTIVTLSLTVSPSDGRDFFIDTSGINNARFNCIQLCLAWAEDKDGYTYYQDIRPCTRINFPNRYLSEAGSSWEIIYQLYF